MHSNTFLLFCLVGIIALTATASSARAGFVVDGTLDLTNGGPDLAADFALLVGTTHDFTVSVANPTITCEEYVCVPEQPWWTTVRTEVRASSFTVSFRGPHQDFLNTVVAPTFVKGVGGSDLIVYVDNNECSGGPPSLYMYLEDESQGFRLSVLVNTDLWGACVDPSGRPFLDGWGFLTDRRFPPDVGNAQGPARDIRVESTPVATGSVTWGALKSRFD